MKHFEEQVSQAAARLRNEENSRLRVPRNPRRSGGVSWGWVATPVAAVAGLLWGVELGRMSGESSLQQVSQVIDTVKVASWQVGEKGKRSRRNCTRSPDTGGKPETGTGDETLQARTGKCVLEDGIDYSMLWEAVKAGK